mmetsp:Transcript_51089/g.75839  ORF Transcript_51089/g.75839 Transcript_51089/m.75839 type:complete len:292 (+) Transcript_51089:115-990(+)|eukprot:CAMPEP_0195521574 /NCGR_PEP_ID=MMETSP0794_2-20130614/18960_1 /TAXON_ID=515487 /ORGANISM="Stephanopyxis turris, Strain CCMP 815" /LENGTH=291 /DNA_ID=CAMNT_0040651155 /DNA_START=105 /DNA_END=980 /DNA_ORIENTATION=+
MEHYHGFAAGSMSAFLGSIVGHPLDTLKVKMQTSTKSAFSLIEPLSLQAFRNLYRGLAFPLCSNGCVNSLSFGVFENTRVLLRRHIRNPDDDSAASFMPGSTRRLTGWEIRTVKNDSDPLWTIAVAAWVAGLSTSPITALSYKLKLEQQVRGTPTVTLLRELPLSRPYRYFYLHSCMESFARTVYLVTYFEVKRALKEAGFDNTHIKWRVVAGALSGVAAWFAIYPLDVARSRLMSGACKETTVMAVLSVMYREGSLYRGLGFTLLRAAPVASVVLTAYDYFLDKIKEYDA